MGIDKDIVKASTFSVRLFGASAIIVWGAYDFDMNFWSVKSHKITCHVFKINIIME